MASPTAGVSRTSCPVPQQHRVIVGSSTNVVNNVAWVSGSEPRWIEPVIQADSRSRLRSAAS